MWESVDDLVQDFGLPVSPNDLEAVEKALKQQLWTVHPDSTNGEFESDDQEKRFQRIKGAIEFIRSQKSSLPALRVSDISTVVEATVLALRQAESQPTKSRPEVMDNVRRELRRLNKFPKITSVTLFGICATIFTFIKSVSEHPLFKDLVEYSGFLWLLGTIWAVSGISLIRVWLHEQAVDEEVRDRLNEQAVQEAFQNVCWHARQNLERRFSRLDVVQGQMESGSISPFFLRRHGHKVPFSLWLRWLQELVVPPVKIDRNAAEEIATFYLNRWSERGAIKRSTYVDAAEWFEVDASVLERHQ